MSKGVKIFAAVACVLLAGFVICSSISSKEKLEKEIKSYKEQCERLTEENKKLNETVSNYENTLVSAQEENSKLAKKLDEYVGMYNLTASMFKILYSKANDKGMKIDSQELIQNAYDTLSDADKVTAKAAKDALMSAYESEEEKDAQINKNDSSENNNNSSAWELEEQGVKDAWKYAAGETYALGKELLSSFLEVFG